MRIIPAIDIIEGKCVRLSKGDYTTQKIYNENPLEVAKQFENAGIQYLHLVDLEGAKSKQIVNHKILEKLASQTQLKIDFGGGLKSDADVKMAFDCGASQITGGSIAVSKPDVFEQWIKTFGSEKIILGADCKNRKIATFGWLEKSTWDVLEFIQEYEEKGVQQVICTDIDKDGMLRGPSLNLYREILQKTKVKLIASGGVSSIEDLEKLIGLGCDGAIVGKAIYEGKITLKQLKELC
ncbi:1-(5-phosphoribosyl)-5-[(5-phosphoribosylamino)methylideneamino]imidazole-4-carboxamide isomerase [Aureisphaera sp. CAU 1614]|uniref:1-(5-phosphoribosyl)-5-[(5-phosphoribosylamino)methylideneamino] imidazole-4-carboxamide isomerase n=1 Tax=Halomarinibacterium sedimenti TaxID=2857106 RepID=A0A9X1FQB0_9FLAO|nr:1-(5-phosphoribosyl)-5-[(5-phosphoribosylamino)methylideneamino]imidazole-4-carboxamide isomerase [Halomarinibacterium sedimenti]MBW2938468.1 1-(5-phosphoribosyl)-5-[(5-phosphoribosylamino)methylideneamino]imidazole-4-carboxamide isomerase [Halomarinibacterium sedimenti]